MLEAFAFAAAGFSADFGQQVSAIGAEIVVQELVNVRIVRVADRIAAVCVRYLAETIKIQLSDKARDIGGLEDGPPSVQIFRLKPLVIEQNRIIVHAPSDRAALALVHDSPELLRESHRLQHAVLVHLRRCRCRCL